jgi:hypothetical protein
MEEVCKDHYFAFYKHFPMCDLALGPIFLKEIQIHYDMNSNPKMLMEKLQMFVSSYVSSK